jgi:hypothetical protein
VEEMSCRMCSSTLGDLRDFFNFCFKTRRRYSWALPPTWDLEAFR